MIASHTSRYTVATVGALVAGLLRAESTMMSTATVIVAKRTGNGTVAKRTTIAHAIATFAHGKKKSNRFDTDVFELLAALAVYVAHHWKTQCLKAMPKVPPRHRQLQKQVQFPRVTPRVPLRHRHLHHWHLLPQFSVDLQRLSLSHRLFSLSGALNHTSSMMPIGGLR